MHFKSYKFDHCVRCETPTLLPYIDMVKPGFGIAAGGNGFAAKSSDEIGKAAARWVLGAFHQLCLVKGCNYKT